MRAQPGVASVYCSIVQQTRNGVECYVRAFKDLIGLPFATVRRRFDTAVVIGFMGHDGALLINPAEDAVLEEGARIIALAHNGAVPLMRRVRSCSTRHPPRGAHSDVFICRRMKLGHVQVPFPGACTLPAPF